MEKLIASFKEPGRWKQIANRASVFYNVTFWQDSVTGVEIEVSQNSPFYNGVWMGTEVGNAFRAMLTRIRKEADDEQKLREASMLAALGALYV